MIKEIENTGDAQQRLEEYFGKIDQVEDYTSMLNLLSNRDAFTGGLEEVSAAIWIAYNSESIKQAPNRFTRAIIDVANRQFGFACQSNVVLTAAATSQAFGNRIKDGVLWKDSFTLGHGEFAHSYQWLTAGFVLKWGTKTAQLYKATAGKLSIVPMFVRDNRGMVMRRANLWEYLVDCTRYIARFDGEAEKAADSWVEGQLAKWANNETTSTAFVDAFFRGKDQRIKGGVKDASEKNYTEVWAILREKEPGEKLKQKVEKVSNIGKFADSLLELYPKRNALTETSFRNANNVTDLAKAPPSKDPSGWFITAYENHRLRYLNLRSNQKLQEMATEELAAILTESEKPSEGDLSRAKAALSGDPSGANFYENLKGGFQKESEWKAKDVTALFREKLQGISALKRERQQHYQSSVKTGQNWATHQDDPSIFTRQIAANEIVDKKQLPVCFHGVKGSINAKVSADSLII